MVDEPMQGWLKRLTWKVSQRQEVVRAYLIEAPHGGLMVPVKEDLEPGSPVELCVRIGESGEQHTLRGAVLWCRREGGGRVAGIGFLSSEVEKREAMLSTNASVANTSERRNPRFATTLRVTYRSATDFVVDYARNISTGGAFIESRNPPAIGRQILFKVYPPGHDTPIDLPGRVAWVRPGQGFGVSFSNDDPASMKELDRLVRRIAIGTPTPVSAPVFEEIRG